MFIAFPPVTRTIKSLFILIVLSLALILTTWADVPNTPPELFQALSTLPASPSLLTDDNILHHVSPSTLWTAFAGTGINTAFGNFVWQELEMTVPGHSVGFNFTRTYNLANLADGPSRIDWTHNYNVSLSVESGTSIVIYMPDGCLVPEPPRCFYLAQHGTD